MYKTYVDAPVFMEDAVYYYTKEKGAVCRYNKHYYYH
jgi:hypothetical protein